MVMVKDMGGVSVLVFVVSVKNVNAVHSSG